MPEPVQPTILNVEDYLFSREATSEILRQAGFRVVEAATGQEALDLVRSCSPHLVLLDVKLPDLSGYEVCQRLKEDPATKWIPVLHISGSYVEGGDKVRGLESGADAYLIKPVNTKELIATIKALLRIREAEMSVRESEERLRLALGAAKMGAWEVNLATREMTRDKRAEELLGPETGWTEFLARIHPDDLPVVSDAIEQAISDRRSFSVEFRTAQSNRNYRWLKASAQAKYDSGHVTSLNGVVHDIGDRKANEQEHEHLLRREREARAEAEAATRARDEFLAIVAHELRSPLNAMLGWAQILLRGQYTPETLKHAVETIESSARSQQKLIEDLLDAARIVRGTLRLEMQPVDLTTVIEAALETVRPAADAKGITLGRSYLKGTDAINGDPERLQQIVWNLLSNAVKFTPEGGRVTVRLERVDPYVQLTVSDTGKGIKEDFLPFVFDRFLQADGSATRRHSGLGLGLSLVSQLVELHGGRVSVASPGEGLGATFVVDLPLRAVRAKADRDTDGTLSGIGPGASVTLDGLRILMVDDDADARELVTVILEQAGAEVVAAASAAEALAVLTDKRISKPDCIVSDISMPDKNGYWLIGKIRSLTGDDGGHLPAVALTAFGRASDRIAVLTAGFQRHVSKPVEPSELVMVIAGLTNRGGPVATDGEN